MKMCSPMHIVCAFEYRSGKKDKDVNLDNKPNFHVACHWEWYIVEYGMPKWWDSERHENKHQTAIADRRLTSGRADMYEQLILHERRSQYK
jgi:hypothetical protein